MRYPAIILIIPHLLQQWSGHRLIIEHRTLVLAETTQIIIAYQIHLHPIATSEAMITVLPVVVTLRKLPMMLH